MSEPSRRAFIKTVVAAAGALGAGAACTQTPSAAGPAEPGARAAEVPPASPPATASTASERPARAAAPPPVEESRMPIRSSEALRSPWQTADPFLFCAYHGDDYPRGDARMGPAAPLAGRSMGSDFSRRDGWSMYHGRVVPGFPRHPHRGFETVTVVRRGLVDHSDSLGATARYGAGDTQWMTAGRGIVHAEMFPLVSEEADNPLELFQIWLNLPAADKMVDPHFTMLWGEDTPRHALRDAAGRVTTVTTVTGALQGRTPPSPPPHSWAARPDSQVAIWTLEMAPGATWTLPAASPGLSRSLYYFKGEGLQVAGRSVASSQRLTLDSDVAITLEAGATGADLLLLEGRPLGEPVAHHGPFVMNSRDELQQAYRDYQRTGFGGWPWPDDAPVHARADGRFAIHADGRKDAPA